MNRGRAVLTFIYLPLAVILWFSYPILIALGQNPEVSEHAALYIKIALPGVFCYSQFNFLRRYLVQLKITKMPLPIIAATTCLHFFWCHLFVNVYEMGLVGGALALTVTYFLDMILLYIAAYKTEEARSYLSLDIAQSLRGWGEYLTIAIPATLQLVILWWYFECLVLMSGIFKDPS